MVLAENLLCMKRILNQACVFNMYCVHTFGIQQQPDMLLCIESISLLAYATWKYCICTTPRDTACELIELN